MTGLTQYITIAQQSLSFITLEIYERDFNLTVKLSLENLKALLMLILKNLNFENNLTVHM